MPKFGLIGYPLSHSFSKKYFNEKFEKEGLEGYHYELYPLENIEQFSELIQQQPDLEGINVTIPYKQAILPFLDDMDAGAAAIGAVNCIQFKQGRLIGYNTDVYGFQSSLLAFIQKYRGEIDGLKALVLGTGGAAQAVMFVLTQLNIPYRLVSRTAQKGVLTYEQLTKNVICDHLLIVNTTPLGMSPKIDTFPDLPYKYITAQHLLYDLVYNPEKTVFLQRGEEAGAGILNGLEMLYRQAEKNWEIWNQ